MISRHEISFDNLNYSAAEISLRTGNGRELSPSTVLIDTDKVSAEIAIGNAPSNDWLIVGGCNGLVVIKHDDLAKYYEGYGWAAIAGALSLLFYGVLTSLGG